MKRVRLLVLLLIIPLIFMISCTQQQQEQQPIGGVDSSISEMGDIQKIKITVDNASVKQGCTENSPVIQTVGKDEKLDVVSQVEDWFAVKLANNQIGFVPKTQSKPVVDENKKPEIPEGTQGGTTETAQGDNTDSPTPKTPVEQTDSGNLTADEQKMFALVNQARAQNNVPALQVDMELTNVARIKAQDMIDNNYFSHNSPTYGDPFDMMKAFGISYVQAGENIAGNQDVDSAHNSLMNSAGHRKNILSPDFTHIGIGIKDGGTYGKMFTQMFISKPK